MSVDSIGSSEETSLLIDFARTVLVAPHVEEPFVERPGTEFCNLTEVSKDGELGVCYAHVGFVGLDVGGCDRLELGGGGGVEEFVQDGKIEGVSGPGDEFLEVDFTDGADWVELNFSLVFFLAG